MRKRTKKMAKKPVRLSDSQKHSVYEMHLAGESIKDIMAAFDVSEPTVYRVLKAERARANERTGKGDGMGKREMVIAGNKRDGRLVSINNGMSYKGTCRVGASMKSREFTAQNGIVATAQWHEWCEELRGAEAAFLENCKTRTEPVVEEVASPEPVDVTPVPAPEIDVKPWRDVAEERKQRIEELERKVEYLEGRIEGYESSKPVLSGDNAYLLWAKSDEHKVFGLYASMEKALKEVDRLNEVASFLVGEGVFEVEEVCWK